MGIRRLAILIFGIILSLRGSIGQTLPDACPGSRVRYSVQGLPNSVFAWTVQGGTISISYNDSIDIQWNNNAGTYQLSVTEVTQNNCTGPVTIAFVNVGGDTANIVGGNQAICLGDLADLTLDKSFTKYLWSDSSTQSFLKPGLPGTYWVQVTNNTGCISRDTINLKVNTPVAIILGADRPVCDTAIILSGPASDSVSRYAWTITGITGKPDTSSLQTVKILNTVGGIRVKLQIVDIHGCTNTDSVKMLECSNVLGINNTITPNGDGVNDVWRIKNIEIYSKAVISLYDRWGRLVYMKNGNYNNDFEGVGPNGNPLPMDSYFYVIDLKDGSKPITGYLLIIR